MLFNNLAIQITFRKASHGIALFRVLSGYFHESGVEGVRTKDLIGATLDNARVSLSVRRQTSCESRALNVMGNRAGALVSPATQEIPLAGALNVAAFLRTNSCMLWGLWFVSVSTSSDIRS